MPFHTWRMLYIAQPGQIIHTSACFALNSPCDVVCSTGKKASRPAAALVALVVLVVQAVASTQVYESIGVESKHKT